MPKDLYLGLFTPADIAARYADLYVQGKAYVDEQNKYHKLEFFLDPGLLLIVVQSTYIDVARYKYFHFDDPLRSKLGATKRSAYLTKWVSRVKPIYPVWPDAARLAAKGDPDLASFIQLSHDPYASINEFFSITYALNSINDELEHLGKKPVTITAAKVKNLMYDLYYRDMSEDAVMALYETLAESSAPAQSSSA